jgi:hypothetical protein
MKCENCHGHGHAWNMLTQEYLLCMECNGSGIVSCCEGNPNKWYDAPISKRLDEAQILIVNTKFDKDGNLVEFKTILDQKLEDEND